MVTMARTRRFLAVPAIALLAAGCPSQDADRADVVEALEEAGASSEQANCVGDGLTDEDSDTLLSQKQLNELADASDINDPDDLDPEIAETVMEVLDGCFDGGSSDEDTGDGETDSTSESTTTTEG
jgi:hypothetical protein